MIDWTKPLEAVHEDGSIEAARLDTHGLWGDTNPDRDGDYWIFIDSFPSSMCCSPTGEGLDGWTIRNVPTAQ